MTDLYKEHNDTIDKLTEERDAAYRAEKAWEDRFMAIVGEDGVDSAGNAVLRLQAERDRLVGQVRELKEMLYAGKAGLRDEFAKAALTGILACTREYEGVEGTRGRAEYVYRVADAMLEARGRDNKP